MGKTKAKWLERDPANPHHVGAETLPYDAALTIKQKMQLLEMGLFEISTSAPAQEDLMNNEMLIWFDALVPAIKVTHKDNAGVVRTGTLASLT